MHILGADVHIYTKYEVSVWLGGLFTDNTDADDDNDNDAGPRIKHDCLGSLAFIPNESKIAFAFSGRSRISCGGPAPIRGGVDLRRRCFSVKMYAKMKELGPIGGGVRPARPPSRSVNGFHLHFV